MNLPFASTSFSTDIYAGHGLINCRHQSLKSSSKNIYLKRDFAAVVYLSEAHSPPMTPLPPSLAHCMRVYCIIIHEGKGGRELTREKVRGATVHKTWLKIPT
jgi:hypothetical protein